MEWRVDKLVLTEHLGSLSHTAMCALPLSLKEVTYHHSVYKKVFIRTLT